MGFDADGYLWYDSHYMDELARFDTKTGECDRISGAALGNCHARILPRCAGADVVWHESQ
jgi:streptogramin lyase